MLLLLLQYIYLYNAFLSTPGSCCSRCQYTRKQDMHLHLQSDEQEQQAHLRCNALGEGLLLHGSAAAAAAAAVVVVAAAVVLRPAGEQGET